MRAQLSAFTSIRSLPGLAAKTAALNRAIRVGAARIRATATPPGQLRRDHQQLVAGLRSTSGLRELESASADVARRCAHA